MLKAVDIVSLFVTCSFIIMILRYLKHKSISASQPKMSMLIFVGGILIAGRVFNAALRISDEPCAAGMWLGHLGFALIFGALFIKM